VGVSSFLNNPIQKIALPMFVPLCTIAIWQILSIINADSTITVVLPPPTSIFGEMAKLVSGIRWWEATASTFAVTVVGFGLGSLSSVVLGLAMGQSATLSKMLNPTLLGLRSLPIVLYVPIVLVLLDSGPKIPVLLSAIATILYSTPPVARAVSALDKEKRRFLRARGYKGWSLYTGFVLPEAISALYLSLSIAVTLSLAVTVVAEILLPSLGGVGSEIVYAREMNHYTTLWALTGLLAAVGFAFHALIVGLWNFSAPWLSTGDE